MRELAPGLHMLRGFPPNGINVYLMGGVIVDAASKFATNRILRQVKGHEVTAHALTHAHPDHQGASRSICQKLGIPFWVGEVDAPAAEDPQIILDRGKDALINKVIGKAWMGPGHPVDRKLREGDEVGGFTVLDVPGHSRGHVAYWRESDRVIVLGDVMNGMNLLTAIPGVREPPLVFTEDPARNRESIRRVAELEPRLVCFGHGPPLRDPAKLQAFVEKLPA